MNLQKQLVGHWTMDLRDTSGTTLRDRSGHDNHGTIKNGPTTGTSSPVGDAYTFDDASTQHINIPHDSTLNLSQDFTITMWVNYTSSGILLCKEEEYEWEVNGSREIRWAIETNGWEWRSTGVTIPAGSWTHLAFQYDGIEVSTYKNGVFQSAITDDGGGSINGKTRNLGIATRDVDNTPHDPFGGGISDVRIYDRLLTDAEIKAVGQQRTPRRNTISPYKFRPRPDDPPNIMDSSGWTVGTSGAQGNFGTNGGSEENSVVEGMGPYGDTVPLWYGRSEDTSSDSEGGWNYHMNIADIDDTKKYRYSVWVKQEYASGKVYHGVERVSNFSGSYVGNPYFWAGDLPTMNDWYLMVGYVHPAGSDSAHEGRIYGTDGSVYDWPQDFQWDLDGGTDSFRWRSYYYYDSNVGRGAYFYDPRLEICDGTETSLHHILTPALYQ